MFVAFLPALLWASLSWREITVKSW